MINKKYASELKKLNPEQLEAVESIEGPVLVIAGPGTGKTQILALRIAFILENTQSEPQNILALTFTESGVRAIKERLLKVIGKSSFGVHVHTFHSFCNEVIQNNPDKFIFAQKLEQIDEVEQIVLIQKILDELNLKNLKTLKSPYFYQKVIITAINTLKQEGISPKAFEKIALKENTNFYALQDLYHEKGINKGKIKTKYLSKEKATKRNLELVKIYTNYEKELKKHGRYDYTDMILRVLEAFRYDRELLSLYQEQFQYLLVDEYQDTNSAQNQIIDLLSSYYKEPNLFVVGDDEQSIYRFQGASLENILFFNKKYPQAKKIILKKNYRSGQTVLDLSRALIKNNEQQIFNVLNIDKKLQSAEGLKSQAYLGQFTSEAVENYFLISEIHKLHKAGIKFSDIACIYRNNHDAYNLKLILKKHKIPFSLEAGANVIEDENIDKLLKILKFLEISTNSEEKNDLLFEIMHFDFFEIPTIDIYRFALFSGKKHFDLFETLLSDKAIAEIELSDQSRLVNLREVLLKNLSYFKNHTFVECFQFLINEINFIEYLLKQPDNIYLLNRLQTLFEKIKDLNRKNRYLNLKQFNEYILLMKQNNLSLAERHMENIENGVKLMTAHKAKGLEFRVVFMFKLIDGLWGNKTVRDLIKLPQEILSIQRKESPEIEEERRLFYVAMTRAKERLYLTWADEYTDSTTYKLPSQFLQELPKVKLKKIRSSIFEKNVLGVLKLDLVEKKTLVPIDLKHFYESILEDFYLSPTAMNAYLKCPKMFFYDNFLKIPKTKTAPQAYGTAVHKALEQIFKDKINQPNKFTLSNFIKYFKTALKKEILNKTDFVRYQQTGKENLTNYWLNYENNFKAEAVIGLEYNFARHRVLFDGIPITGKIDKIVLLDKVSQEVAITDYKTSQPKTENYLMAKTKENNTDFLYQAYFYKLLAEEDKFFHWKIKQIFFDFTEPENHKFKNIELKIDKDEFQNFKKVLKETYQNISEFKFSEIKDCPHKKECDYKDFC